MKLIDMIARSPAPISWSEGDNIPWHEAGFSERMLREHLSQEHDAASRRFEIIDRHVAWIHENGRRMPRPVAGDESAEVAKLQSKGS